MSFFDVFSVGFAVAATIPFADTLTNVWGFDRHLTAARSAIVVALSLLLCLLLRSAYPAVIVSRLFVVGIVSSAARHLSLKADFIRYPLQAAAIYVTLDLFLNSYDE